MSTSLLLCCWILAIAWSFARWSPTPIGDRDVKSFRTLARELVEKKEEFKDKNRTGADVYNDIHLPPFFFPTRMTCKEGQMTLENDQKVLKLTKPNAGTKHHKFLQGTLQSINQVPNYQKINPRNYDTSFYVDGKTVHWQQHTWTAVEEFVGVAADSSYLYLLSSSGRVERWSLNGQSQVIWLTTEKEEKNHNWFSICSDGTDVYALGQSMAPKIMKLRK